MKKTVAVAMTTFNGEKYIIEQLESLRLQSRDIDEVVICDDCSQDTTYSIVEKYILEHNLEKWKLIRNQKQAGWKNNFKKAIDLLNSDIVFYCDQDDIWHYNKVELMAEIFEKNANVKLLVSNFHSFTECGDVLPRNNQISTELEDNIKKVKFGKTYYAIKRPGCVMAVEREIVDIYRELFLPETPHDALVWMIGNLMGKLYLYDEELIEYRKHGGNVTDKRSHNINDIIHFLHRLILTNAWYLNSKYYNEDNYHIVKGCSQWAKYRLDYIENKKFICFFKLIKYIGYYENKKKFIGDFYYYFKAVCKK